MIFDLGYYAPSNPKLQPSSQANPAAFELLKIESRESNWCANLIDGLSSSPRRIQPDIDLAAIRSFVAVSQVYCVAEYAMLILQTDVLGASL